MVKPVSVNDYKYKVGQRVKETEDKNRKDDGGSGDEIDSKFIMECLNKNQLGDGELYKKLFRDHFVFNKAMDTWMEWTGHHWEIDIMNNALVSVEKVADKCEFSDEYTVQATDVYKAFCSWCRNQGIMKIVTQKKFGAVLSSGFDKMKNGTVQYVGLRLKNQ